MSSPKVIIVKKPTLAELKAWFAAAPRDYGWDFIIAYDRRTLNDLLVHQYIEQFREQQTLPLFSASVTTGHITEHLSRMRLRPPGMSFELSDLGSGEAHLGMDLAHGMLITEERAGGVPFFSRIREMSPAGTPRLTFVTRLVDLGAAPGSDGSIVLDLSKGDEYRVNFVLDSLSQIDIGRRFGEFLADVPAACKRFALGRMSDLLGPPRNVLLRLMAAPGADQPNHPDHGDGALLMFVAYGPFDGTTPGNGSDFLYPIPGDAPDKPFSITFMMRGTSGLETEGQALSPTPPFMLEEVFLGNHLGHYVWDVAFGPGLSLFAYYGHIALRESAFAIQPHLPVMVAGESQRFSVKPSAGGLKWRVQATEAGDSDIGRIGIDGVYTAPDSLIHASKTVMITVEGLSGWGSYEASMLVTILRESVSVSPMFATCHHGTSIELSAQTSPGSQPPQFRLARPELGGTLRVEFARRCTYTARRVGSNVPPYVDVVEVVNPTTGEVKPIHIVVVTQVILLPLFISEDSRPEDDNVQLRTVFDGKEMNLGDVPGGYTLVQEPRSYGWISSSGAYQSYPSARGMVILMLEIEDPVIWYCGFLALPLPLSAHVEALTRSHASLRANARRGLPKLS